MPGYVRLAILTNGVGAIQREKVARTGLAEIIEQIFVSGEVGFGKPDPRFFNLAVTAMGGSLVRTAHVGDSLESDVAGALGAGMFSVWIDRRGFDAPSVSTHARIDSLDQLATALAMKRTAWVP